MNACSIQAEFVETAGGRIFALARVPDKIRRPAVLIAPPFGEEMNKTRRMVTELTGRLLQSGTPTILVDLHGTGDSEGEFADASWPRWVEDLVYTAQWAADRGFPIGALLGIRLGCLLALEAAPRMYSRPRRALFWQPVLSGRRFLDQFLRIGVAAALARGRAGASVAEFRRRLSGGIELEIAGYTLTPALAAGIDSAGMNAEGLGVFSGVDWLEIVPGDPPALPDSSHKIILSATRGGARIFAQPLRGMPYWTATETVVEPALIERTVECLNSGPA